MEVPPERLVSWIVNFTRRHGAGPVSRDETGSAVTFIAADGSAAECHPPFPPLSGGAGGGDPAAAAEQIVTHAMADRTVGVLMARLGGWHSAADPSAAMNVTAEPVSSRDTGPAP